MSDVRDELRVICEISGFRHRALEDFRSSLILRRVTSYGVAHEKPARRLVEQRGRRSRTLYRKLNKCKCKVLVREGAENDLLVRQCTFVHAAAYCHTHDTTQWCLRIDTAELHRVYDSMLQRAQKCIDVQGDHFQRLL